MSAVTDLVALRIYPLAAPQGADMPYVVYDTSIAPGEAMDGHSGMTFADFSFNVYDETYTSVKAISEQVRLALDGWSGSASSVTVTSVIHQSSSDVYGSPRDGKSTGVYQVNLSFRVGHVTAVPS